MEIGHLIPHIEALIFASDKPLTGLELTDLINNAFGFMEDKIVLDQVESALEGIVEKYRSEFYPFEVKESGGGWQFLTKRDFHKTVAQLNGEKFLKRLSSAALEALSIIAYKQPVTKAEIEAIRGVSSDYAIQKLLEKELIVITGRNEALPGHPLVYGTSKNFMDYFGINTAEDLPKLKEVFDETIVNATNVTEAIAQQHAGEDAEVAGGEEAILAVGENGELIQGIETTPYINGTTVAYESENQEGENAAEDEEIDEEAEATADESEEDESGQDIEEGDNEEEESDEDGEDEAEEEDEEEVEESDEDEDNEAGQDEEEEGEDEEESDDEDGEGDEDDEDDEETDEDDEEEDAEDAGDEDDDNDDDKDGRK
ncbi:SMC-Scp complex subunit ScpB [Paraflavitalea sp. CAU 1676]|uniref:SMC-Scp complex subunit ScpB n=1 Tax=Paraflavitalea sp. CAU 1676 TaxID=3032598 RepID=UPI0023DC3C72|nr:SMC-Scp complex subunit ScpB [Paraflavitalea sp. CAU 1676]MDF2193692.1 SMC-Scp complex subunit ScpB [Paraflavitalea sp. CAU 1676]